MEDTVLIVDDDESVRTVLYKAIRSNGIAAELAASGEQALHCVEKNAYDLILLDINMPGMDGFQVVQTLRRQGNQTPIILISGRQAVDGGDGVVQNRTYVGKAAILEAIVRWHISGYLWDKIFRRKAFEKVRLPQGIQLAEDTWCLIDMADNNVCSVYVSDKGGYFYRQRSDSAVRTFTAAQCLNLFQMSFHLLYELNKTQGVSSETNVNYFMVTYRRLLDAWIVNADLPCFNEYLNGIATLPPPQYQVFSRKRTFA